jgi:hypothetical protein
VNTLRDLYKKVYTLHRKLFPEAMSFMNYGTYIPAIHSFADFLLCAERYETRADRSIYDMDGGGNLNSFRRQSSLPFGPKAMHNGWLKYPLAMDEKGPTVHLYGIVLLHDLVQWNINENPQVRRGVHELKKRIGIGYDRAVEFLPYWDHSGSCQVDSADLVVSFYRRGRQLMAALVNTRMRDTYRGRVVLDLEKLGIGEVQRIELYDPMDGSYLPLECERGSGTVTIRADIAPTLFKAILLN